MAFCTSNDDCTIDSSTSVTTGSCNSDGRCECSSDSWTGPRCTEAASESGSGSDDNLYGPPMYVSILIGIAAIVVTLCVIAYQVTQRKKNLARLRENDLKVEQQKDLGASSFSSMGEAAVVAKTGKERTSFV
ncbi:Beta-glucan synthesis-associated protein [Phytophthora cinnamomi]|uniref:Beta-glucan synthesis-associated protein n=1 Tax=Phytophthora cinnamomi TaxID=4785 RepID=UPI003559EF1A|nr:Beta-glucan synthesis-associated protein [Phytophthora cinnamomi]